MADTTISGIDTEAISSELTDWFEMETVLGNSRRVKLETILALIYPIGAIYESTNVTNPSILLGGTWTSLGSNRWERSA